MTHNELVDYFRPFVRKAELVDDAALQGFIDRAVSDGLREFWGANMWTFAEKVDTMTTTASTAEYALPLDFDSMISIREQTSSSGRSLEYVPREQFDKLAPRPDQIANGTPTTYTIFNNDSQSKNKLRITFFPVPDAAITLYRWYRIVPDKIDQVPDKFVGAVKAITWKHIVSPINPSYGTVAVNAAQALHDAIMMDRRNTERKIEIEYGNNNPMRRYPLWDRGTPWVR